MKDELNRSYNGGEVVYLRKSEVSHSSIQYAKSLALQKSKENADLPSLLAELNQSLNIGQHPEFFVGDKISMADMSFFWLWDILASVAPPEALELLKAYEHLYGLFTRLQEHPKLQQYLKFRCNDLVLH